jgi:hypothetical protein
MSTNKRSKSVAEPRKVDETKQINTRSASKGAKAPEKKVIVVG